MAEEKDRLEPWPEDMDEGGGLDEGADFTGGLVAVNENILPKILEENMAVLDHAWRRVIRDIMDPVSPVGKPRKIVLTIHIETDGSRNTILVWPEPDIKLPKVVGLQKMVFLEQDADGEIVTYPSAIRQEPDGQPHEDDAPLMTYIEENGGGQEDKVEDAG